MGPRRPGLLAAALALAGAAAWRPPGVNIDAPPVAHTGGFGEPTCLECHIGAPPNVEGGRLTLQGLPGAYTAGARYDLTIVLESEEMAAAGFQLAARFADGTPAGELTPIAERVAVTHSERGVPYVHHTRQGTPTANPDRASWTFAWTAPASNADVVFSFAANSANGDNSPLSDLIYFGERALAAATGLPHPRP